jgi:hypothetical protein
MKRNRVKINGKFVNKDYLASFLDLKPHSAKTQEELKGIYFLVPNVGEEAHAVGKKKYHYVQVVDGIPYNFFERNEIYWK